MDRLNVVIVDDDRIQRIFIEKLCHYCLPIDVTTTASAAEAKSLMAQRTNIDGMIIDLVLEDGSGLEVSKEAKAKGIPFVFHTSSADDHNMQLMYEAGGFVIRKPATTTAIGLVLDYFNKLKAAR